MSRAPWIDRQPAFLLLLAGAGAGAVLALAPLAFVRSGPVTVGAGVATAVVGFWLMVTGRPWAKGVGGR